MSKRQLSISRRQFLQASALGLSTVTIVPRSVLGSADQPPPCETLGAAVAAERSGAWARMSAGWPPAT
jgi:hypothetical protein